MKYKTFFSILFLITFSTLYSQQNNKSSIIIKDSWTRPTMTHMNSAIYFTVVNSGSQADTLLDVESKVADIVQVHESFKRGNDQMGMRQVDFVAIPPNASVVFKPGSYHVMLIDMQQDVKANSVIDAVLTFKHAGKIKMSAKAKETMNTEN